MSRRSHITRQITAAGPNTPRPEAVVAGSSPAFGSLLGEGAHAADTGQGVLGALSWWQTPRLDPYVMVEDHAGGHAFVVLQTCDLLINLHVDVTLPEDAAEPGYFRSGINTLNEDSGAVVDYYSSGGYGVEPGPWTRAAFVSSDLVNYAGLNITRPYRFDKTGSTWPRFDIYATFENRLSNNTLYFTWKLTVMLLDESTPRTLSISS